MCHRYKLDSLNWCCLSLPCFDGKKLVSLMKIFLKFYSYSYKNIHNDGIYVSVGIVGLLRIRARQCTSTPSLQNGYIFGSQDA